MNMKKGGLIATIVGVVLIVVGSVLLLTSGPSKSNKELFTEAVQKSLGLFTETGDGQVESTIKEITESIEKNIYKLSINASVNQGEASYGKADALLYFGKNQAYFKLNSDANDEVFNLEGMLKNDKFYFEIKNVLENVYYIDKVSEIFNQVGVSSGDTKLVEKVVNYLAESFMDAIKDEDVTVESSDLTINGKSYSTKKYAYTFSGNTLYNVVLNFINKVKNDKDIVNELNSILEQYGDMLGMPGNTTLTKDDLNKVLDQIPEYAKELQSIGNLLTYTVYMYKDEPVSRQISVMIPSEQSSVPVVIADYKGEGYYKISLSTMGMEMYKLELVETSTNNYSISLKMMDQEVVTGYIKNDNGNYEIKIQPISGGLKLKDDSHNSIVTKKYDDDDDFDFDYDDDDDYDYDDDDDFDFDYDDDDYDYDDDDDESEMYILININKDKTGSVKVVMDETNLLITYKLEQVSEVPEMDIANSKPFEQMSEKDKDIFESFIGMFNVMGHSKKSRDVSRHIEAVPSNCEIDEYGDYVCSDEGLEM